MQFMVDLYKHTVHICLIYNVQTKHLTCSQFNGNVQKVYAL